MRVAGRDEESCAAVVHEFRRTAHTSRDHSSPPAHRLDDDAAQAFRSRGEDEERRLVQQLRDLLRREAWEPPRPVRKVGDELRDQSFARTGADDHEPGLRHARRREPPGVSEPVDVLVELEDADEQRLRPFRERRGRVRERLEIHERREDVVRRTSRLLHEPRRVARDRTDSVGAAQCLEGDPVAEGCQ